MKLSCNLGLNMKGGKSDLIVSFKHVKEVGLINTRSSDYSSMVRIGFFYHRHTMTMPFTSVATPKLYIQKKL